MMVPQPTAQYGQVERVSLARAIFRTRNCAYAGFKSKPNTAAAAPPIVVNFRKSRRARGIIATPSLERKGRGGCQEKLETAFPALGVQIVFTPRRALSP